MHELSLAGGIVRLVEDAAERERFRRVSLLRLEAGALSGVEVRAALRARGQRAGHLSGRRRDPHRRATRHRLVPGLRAVGRDRLCAPTPALMRGFRLQPTGGTELRCVVDLMVHDD